MAMAADLVHATMGILQDLRTESKWEQVLKYVQEVASLHNIHAEAPRSQRARQIPRRYEDGLVIETTGSREELMTSEYLNISIYFPILDAMLSELDRRFAENLEHMRSIQACSPHSPNFLSNLALYS